ncbi:MAG: hypothetical protein QM696_05630 [Steroidobacteraceae bacterium]
MQVEALNMKDLPNLSGAQISLATALLLLTTVAIAQLPPVPEPLPQQKAPQGSFTRTVEGQDLTGVWMIKGYVGSGAPIEKRILRDMNGDLVPTQPWAEKLYQERIANEINGHTFPGPPTSCLPHGMPQMMWAATYPVQILQTPRQVTFIHELARQYRIVHLDRGHPDPEDLDSTYYGDSVGWWEGDTLVIDTIGLTKKNTLDMLGMPTSDQMHVIERIKRPTNDKLDILITVDDPGVFTKPWTRHLTYALQPRNIEVTEYICLDGNRNPVVNGRVTIDGRVGPSP